MYYTIYIKHIIVIYKCISDSYHIILIRINHKYITDKYMWALAKLEQNYENKENLSLKLNFQFRKMCHHMTE